MNQNSARKNKHWTYQSDGTQIEYLKWVKRGKNREKKLEKSVFLEKMIDSETRKKKFDE